MQVISQRLSNVTLYGPPLDLESTPPAWLNRVRSLRLINATGTGEMNFVPGRTTNRFSLIQTGTTFRLEALGVNPYDPATFFTIDNGTPPAADSKTQAGTFEGTGTGRQLRYAFPHQLGLLPQAFLVVPGNETTPEVSRAAATATEVVVEFDMAPAPSDAILLHWSVTAPSN